jgi:hypothetical protein
MLQNINELLDKHIYKTIYEKNQTWFEVETSQQKEMRKKKEICKMIT